MLFSVTLSDLHSPRVERLLCFFVFFAIEKVCQHDVGCLSLIVFFFSLPLLRNAIGAFNVVNAKPEEAALD